MEQLIKNLDRFSESFPYHFSYVENICLYCYVTCFHFQIEDLITKYFKNFTPHPMTWLYLHIYICETSLRIHLVVLR